MKDREQPPRWAAAVPSIVTLVVLGLLVWEIVIVGPEGYPTSVILAGLLGAYRAGDELMKQRQAKIGPPAPPPAPEAPTAPPILDPDDGTLSRVAARIFHPVIPPRARTV